MRGVVKMRLVDGGMSSYMHLRVPGIDLPMEASAVPS